MTKELENKLDILIKISAANLIKEDKTQTESILRLSGMGIGYRDIARILGCGDSYVALILSKNKKKGEDKNAKSKK